MLGIFTVFSFLKTSFKSFLSSCQNPWRYLKLPKSYVTNNSFFPPFIVDVDECTKASHTCDRHASCTDTIGSYDCACNAGYRGSGTSCNSKSSSVVEQFCEMTTSIPEVSCNVGRVWAHSLKACVHTWHFWLNLGLFHFSIWSTRDFWLLFLVAIRRSLKTKWFGSFWHWSRLFPGQIGHFTFRLVSGVCSS